MGNNQQKGWLSVPGIRPHADRTLAEQMMGLELALKETAGKTVLDLGCAEGLIGREFAVAGAKDVLGIESLESHLAIARKACADQMPPMRFQQAYLQEYMHAHQEPEIFDIVLCLGIIHKIDPPESLLRWSARACRELLLFRAPANAWNGMVRSKHNRSGRPCHVPTEMARQGFKLERHIPGARGEGVEYWRRT